MKQSQVFTCKCSGHALGVVRAFVHHLPRSLLLGQPAHQLCLLCLLCPLPSCNHPAAHSALWKRTAVLGPQGSG